MHLGTLALVVFALVRPYAAPAASMLSCEADRKKLCSNIEYGGGRVMACLKEHEKDLSSECREQLTLIEESGHAKPECRADAQKLCRPAIGDPAKMKACMQ